jgi:hypothetical protein
MSVPTHHRCIHIQALRQRGYVVGQRGDLVAQRGGAAARRVHRGRVRARHRLGQRG